MWTQVFHCGLRCGLRCVWLHQVGVSASPGWTQVWTQVIQVWTQVRLAAPGGRFSVSRVDPGVDSSAFGCTRWAFQCLQGEGKGGGGPRRIEPDPPVGTLWAPFLPLLEPSSETLLGNKSIKIIPASTPNINSRNSMGIGGRESGEPWDGSIANSEKSAFQAGALNQQRERKQSK